MTLLKTKDNKQFKNILIHNTLIKKVSDLSNDELFVLDLINRFPDLSEEEIEIELSKEQNNPDLFNKKVIKLRESYEN